MGERPNYEPTMDDLARTLRAIECMDKLSFRISDGLGNLAVRIEPDVENRWWPQSWAAWVPATAAMWFQDWWRWRWLRQPAQGVTEDE